MTKIQHFSGIDISKMNFEIRIDESKSKKFSYTEEGMQAYCSLLPSNTHCIMEATGTYHCRLAYFLYEHGIKVSVVNPLSVKRFSQALMLRTKTDKADTKLLIEYGKQFNPELWVPKEDCYIELQQLINLQDQLTKQETATKNQLESISHSVVQSDFAKGKIAEQLKKIQFDLKEIKEEMERLILLHEKDNYQRLQSIPGIGKQTAIVLLAITQGMKKFDSSKQVSSYFGLAPRIYESGTSVKGKSKICKMGMSMIRKLLYLCSLSAKKYNNACRELYQRLLAKGKMKKVALIAVANKLIKQIFSIIKNKTSYQQHFLSKNPNL